ncbi:MAG: GNAT family N-acetyltransferase [Muribaculaceae bacterium]|nr:GNAT family N-acetyltransferase [Muribaculaceae bacterium]
MTIRQATQADTEYVAKTVLTALDMDTSDLGWVKESCADPKSMYSWNKALIAEQDGAPVGCIISYRGDDYLPIREYTWSRLWKGVDPEVIRKSAIETYPGEYYLDSLSVDPEFRGHGLGKKLMQAAIDYGASLGYRKFALLVAVEKPRLKAYYASLGFKEVGEVNFFGHRYHRMLMEGGHSDRRAEGASPE